MVHFGIEKKHFLARGFQLPGRLSHDVWESKAAWGACLWSVCSPLSWKPSSLTHLSFQCDLYLP